MLTLVIKQLFIHAYLHPFFTHKFTQEDKKLQVSQSEENLF
jgi:hypothetical protein